MEERINFLEAQVEALQRKIELLEEHNNTLFDYADMRMMEGCKAARKLIDKILKDV